MMSVWGPNDGGVEPQRWLHRFVSSSFAAGQTQHGPPSKTRFRLQLAQTIARLLGPHLNHPLFVPGDQRLLLAPQTILIGDNS